MSPVAGNVLREHNLERNRSHRCGNRWRSHRGLVWRKELAVFACYRVLARCLCGYLEILGRLELFRNAAARETDRENAQAENHGAQIEEGEKDTPEGRSGMCTVLYDKRILTLMATTTIFEGSMYLFVFFWSPALKSSRVASGNLAAPPFGMVFSCFMCAMMLGSMIFGSIDMRHEKDPARLMLDIVALAANSLLIPALATNETAVFWCFALFELSVGLYFPSMSRLKSDIVADAVRGKVYGMMRLPLNVLVVCTLSMTREGEHNDMTSTPPSIC